MTAAPVKVGLILGAAVWADGPSPTLRRRCLHGADLYHQGKVQHLIGCGGLGRFPPTEAAVIGSVLQTQGVPTDRISFEDRSSNTLENIQLALPILNQLGTTDLMIITDWYHAPRARLIARRLGLTATSSSPPLTGARLTQQIKSALREIPAYLLAWVRD